MDDLQRLKDEYTTRDSQYEKIKLYSFLNPSQLFAVQNRQRTLAKVLRKYELQDLFNYRVLEVGCGEGKLMMEFSSFGVRLNNFFGLELLENRVHKATEWFPFSPILQGDARFLPYKDNSFNLVLQYTVFSSILDDNIKKKISTEMLRVLKKPDGFIVWYDFWLNPTNPQTKGIRPKEIRSLFPNCEFDFRKITLAPPIARRLVPISWLLSAFLEKLTIFNTHYLVAIRPNH